MNWPACAKERYKQGFQIFTTKSAQLLLKTNPKLAQSRSGGKYHVSEVMSTHEVEKQRAATVEKVAQFRRKTRALSYGSKHGGHKVSDYVFIYSVICCIIQRNYAQAIWKIKTRMWQKTAEFWNFYDTIPHILLVNSVVTVILMNSSDTSYFHWLPFTTALITLGM